jgi:hypothetical protein
MATAILLGPTVNGIVSGKKPCLPDWCSDHLIILHCLLFPTRFHNLRALQQRPRTASNNQSTSNTQRIKADAKEHKKPAPYPDRDNQQERKTTRPDAQDASHHCGYRPETS